MVHRVLQMTPKAVQLIHENVVNSTGVHAAVLEEKSSLSAARRMVERILGVQRAWIMCVIGSIIRFFFPFVFPMGMHMDEESEANLRAAVAQTGRVGLQERLVSDKLVSEPTKYRPVILLPTHKSHIDYIAQHLIMEELGLPTPLVVAGDNLNMPMFGSILHASGAMFIRRSFSGDKVYSAVFNQTMIELLKNNHILGCFIEGGRSRSGKLLTPKAGFLKSIVDAVLDGQVEDALIVPVSFSYGRVVEARSMIEEMSGGAKKKEAFGSSLRSIVHLVRTTFWGSACFGSVEISVAPAFSVKEHLKSKETRDVTAKDTSADVSPSAPTGYDLDAVHQPGTAVYKLKSSDRKLSIVLDDETMHDKKTRVQLALSLGFRNMHECNRVGVIQGTALVGTILLMHKDRGLKTSDLVDKVEWLRSEIVARGGKVQAMKSVQDTVAEVVDKIMWGSGRARLVKKHKSVVMTGLFTPMETLELSTFRNNLIHFFIQDGIVAVAMHACIMRAKNLSSNSPTHRRSASPDNADDSRRRSGLFRMCSHTLSLSGTPISLTDVQQGAQFLSVLLKHEFIYKPVVSANAASSNKTFSDNFNSITQYMTERRVIEKAELADEPVVAGDDTTTGQKISETHSSDLIRVSHKGHHLWEFLCGLLFPFIDSYYLCLLGCFVLLEVPNESSYEMNSLVSKIQEIGENLYMNNLMDCYDAVAKDTLVNALTAYADIGLLSIDIQGKGSKIVKVKVPRSALLETIELVHSFRKGKGGKHGGDAPHNIADAIDLAQALSTN